MFKEFMEEVAAIEAAGAFSEPEIVSKGEVAEGEEVVGCIADDHYLMALCMAGENRAKAYMDKISQMATEDEIRRVYKEFGPIIDMTWAEIRLRFGISGGTVGLRKGWKVVRVKDEQQDEQPMPEARVIGLLIPHGVLDASGDCGNPDCPKHGKSRIGRRKIVEA